MAIGLTAVVLLASSCESGGEQVSTAPTQSTISSTAPASTAPATTVPAVTTTTVPPPQGVETYAVSPSHTNDQVVYPQTPPVGGPHNPVWETCVFRDRPVPNESAVHSLEHGAVWITYRPDVPTEQLDVLKRLASSRRDVLVSRWDVGLPAPVVVTSWGRQMKLDSTEDPRLLQFVRAFSGQAPEPGAPC